METRTITKWLQEYSFTNLNENVGYYKHDLEEIIKRFLESGATYCEIIDDEVDFYIETEETSEERNLRLKQEEDARKTIEKYKYQQAKETYLKYKDEFN